MKLVALLLALATGVAQASIGSVTEMTGAASIKRGNSTVTVATGTVIEKNDQVTTKNGKLKIVFQDKTTVSVTEHSSLVIDDFVYDDKSGSGRLGLKAAGGTVRYVSGAIASKNPNAVKINTPTAAIAVRGTDFVMSVNEAGSSMIVLMPSCEIEPAANLKGLTCGSGAIDVESGPNLVSMNRPFQATVVETAGQPPSPPMTISLFGTPIGNNLQITPPRMPGGGNLLTMARSALERTGVVDRSRDRDKDSGSNEPSQEAQTVAADSAKDDSAGSESTSTVVAKTETSVNPDALANQAAGTSETENPYLFKLWKDKSETVQLGWLYESLSPNGRNYANITQTMDTKIQIIVTQDMQTNAWSFAQRTVGQIVINQTYR